VSVTAIPGGISADGVNDMLATMADRLKNGTGNAELTRDILFEKALYQASCKASIKGGREYPPEYVEWLVAEMMKIPDITVCPHGRPVAMEISRKNLERQFGRT
jgi:DNA mismatch repair protein MutL